MYVLVHSIVVPWYSGMGQIFYIHACTCINSSTCQYTPKDSHVVQYMVQRDGIDTLDRLRTCMQYIPKDSQVVPSHGTVGWDRHSRQSTYMYMVHASTFPRIPMWSHDTAGWDRPQEKKTE